MDIKERINKRFNKQALSFHRLLKMVEQQLDEQEANPSSLVKEEDLFLEDEQGSIEKNILDFLPKIQISEDWGVVGSEDRAVFEKYMNKIRGDNLPDKISFINQFVSGRTT